MLILRHQGSPLRSTPMVFSSILFLLYFLPAALLVYYLCPDRFKNYLLLILSIGFYSWGAPRFIFVILGTTLLDFFLVGLMYRQQKRSLRRFLLVLSVCMNVGLLFYFKYANFFISNINELLGAMGTEPFTLLDVVLPSEFPSIPLKASPML
ncbi:MAG: hypothetical protein ACHQRM_13825 [Bacteroidia bacterium]